MRKILYIFSLIFIFTLSGCKELNSPEEDNQLEEQENIYLNCLEYEIINKKVNIVKFLNNVDSLIIPEEIEGYPVTKINEKAFYKSDILEVSLPSTITTLEYLAFSYCNNLKKLEINSNIEYIKFSSITDCENLIIYTELVEDAEGWDSLWTFQKVIYDCNNAKVVIEDKLTYLIEEDYASVFSCHTSAVNVEILNEVIYDDEKYNVLIISESAFESCDNLKTVVFNESLVTIEKDAFRYCKLLESVELKNNVKTIEEYAFSSCYSLNNVIIPESLEVINKFVFQHSKISEIYIPKGVEISSYAFIDCNDLVIYVDEVSKPSSWGNYWNGSAVTVFDYKNKELFKEDIYLFELIDGEVSIIKCFSNESKIVIPNNIVYNDISYPVTIIDDSAFSKKAQLSEITFPNTLKTIGKYSFEDCTNLSEITLPNSLKTIKDYAFENCSSLSVVIIPLSVETMGFAIFPKYAQNLVIKVEAKEDAEGWTPSWNNGCAIIYDYLNNIQFAHNNITYILKDEYLSVIYVSSTSVVIPSFVTYEGVDYPVKRINENAFTYTLITDVVINEGVEVIERGAFFNCTSLTSIVLPNSLKEIGDSAFSSCSSLREIVIPKNVTTIEKNAFYYCYSLVIFVEKNSTEVNYDSLWNGDSIVIYDCQNQIYLKTDSFLYHIVDNEATLIAYYKNESSNVVIPNTITINDTNYDVTRISDNVFYNNEMKSIVLPNSLKEIGINTFSLCSSLREINLPDGLIHIGSNAFSGLAITTIKLPESLYKIDSSAFSSCKNLEEIVIPKNIETISEYTFYNCISLSSVTLNNGLVEIQKYAFVNTAIEELILPSSLKTIGYSAFSDCSSLQEVTFNDGLEYIEEYAFQNTSVETVKLPSTIIKLYLSAFMKTNVDVIYLNAKEDTALVVSASTGASQPTIYEYLNKEIIETDNYIYSVEDNQATLVLCKQDKEEIALENTINSIPVTIIGTYAFNDCTTLRDIILPNQLLEIKNAAFYDTNIGNVVLPSTLEKIYYNSFENTNYMVFYTELESKKSEWIISDTNTIIYDYLNKEIIEENNLVYVIEDEKAILYGLNTLLTTIVIPEYVSNYPVYRIERYAFYSTQINELVLPNTLEEIAYRSFENCTLESVFMPSEVKTIDLEAFCTRNKIVIYTSLSYRPSGWHENLSYDYIIFYNQNQ